MMETAHTSETQVCYNGTIRRSIKNDISAAKNDIEDKISAVSAGQEELKNDASAGKNDIEDKVVDRTSDMETKINASQEELRQEISAFQE
jgi:gas vesicle protein